MIRQRERPASPFEFAEMPYGDSRPRLSVEQSSTILWRQRAI
jgi:hypothetical protein